MDNHSAISVGSCDMDVTHEKCTRKLDHEIGCLRSLTPSLAQALQSHWIVSVEQFVAAAATAQGRKGLESLLGGGASIVDGLLRQSLELLGRTRYEALIQAKAGGPLGAKFNDPMVTSCGSKEGAI